MSFNKGSCDWCGKEFYTKSKLAKYCGGSCKQRAYERRRVVREESRKQNLNWHEIAVLDAVAKTDTVMASVLEQFFVLGEVIYLKALCEVLRRGDLNMILWEYGLFERLSDIAEAITPVSE